METKGTGLARGQTEKNTSLDVAGLESSAEQVDLRRRVGFCCQARPIQVSSGSMWAMKRFGSFCRLNTTFKAVLLQFLHPESALLERINNKGCFQ